MKIEIEGDGGLYNVRCGDQLAEACGFDEALGVVAAILLGVKPRYMKTVPREMPREPEPEWPAPPKLDWRWIGNGRWAGASGVGGEEHVYRIAQDGDLFRVSGDEYLCVGADHVFPAIGAAQAWCEDHDNALIPF